MSNNRRRWLGRLTLVAVVVWGQGLIATPDAVIATSPVKPYDFNADGYADLAIGVPGDRVGRKDGAGAVNVVYGSKKGLTAKKAQLWSQGSRGIKGDPSEYEMFGSVLTSGDFDCDGRADLAVENQTKVAVLYGSRKGLSSRDQLIGAGLGVFDGSARRIEHLAAGDFDADGCSELAVAGEGRLVVLRGSKRGLRGAKQLVLPVGIAQPGTWYRSLAAGDLTGDRIADLVLGGAAPATAIDPGVAVIPGSAGGLRPTQARQYAAPPRPAPSDRTYYSWHYGASLAIGDFNGDGHRDLAIGDSGAGREVGWNDQDEPVPCPSSYWQCSGAMVLLPGTSAGLSAAGARLWTKSSLGQEYQLGIGLGLAAGDVNADGRDDLAVGAYGEVMVLRGTAAGLTRVGLQRWTWDTPGVAGEVWDRHGYNGPFSCGVVRLLDHGRGRGADLSAGSYGYRTYTGAMSVLYGSTVGITAAGDQLWRQNSRGVPGRAQTGDELGATPACAIDEG